MNSNMPCLKIPIAMLFLGINPVLIVVKPWPEVSQNKRITLRMSGFYIMTQWDINHILSCAQTPSGKKDLHLNPLIRSQALMKMYASI